MTKDYESPQFDITLYCQLVNTLIYLTHSRQDISFFISVCPTSCKSLQKVIGMTRSISSTIWRVPLTLASNIVNVQTRWLATLTLTRQETMMIQNPLQDLFSASILYPWSGPLRNKRLSLYRLLKLSIVVQSMLALRLFGSNNYWESLGLLSKPQLFFIVTIKVQSRSLIILLHTVRWSMMNFIAITWDSWFNKRLLDLFIAG